jgi:hypothetical protein
MRFQAVQVKRHRTECAGRDVNEMATRYVLGVTAAAHEDAANPSLQIQNSHLGAIKAPLHLCDREEHGAPARKRLRPEVIGFTSGRVGPRERGNRPP